MRPSRAGNSAKEYIPPPPLIPILEVEDLHTATVTNWTALRARYPAGSCRLWYRRSGSWYDLMDESSGTFDPIFAAGQDCDTIRVRYTYSTEPGYGDSNEVPYPNDF